MVPKKLHNNSIKTVLTSLLMMILTVHEGSLMMILKV